MATNSNEPVDKTLRECFDCGGLRVYNEWDTQHIHASKEDIIQVRVPVWKCPDCGDMYTDGDPCESIRQAAIDKFREEKKKENTK